MIRFLARLQPWAILLVRLTVGFSMVYHSWSKVYPADGLMHGYRHHTLLSSFEHFNQFVATLGLPRWLGYVSTVTEFLGGLCLLLGLLTRFWALLICTNMLVALAIVNVKHGYTGSEYSVALVAMAFLLFTTGSGAFSLDRKFRVA
jgi:putative oxidoreductase